MKVNKENSQDFILERIRMGSSLSKIVHFVSEIVEFNFRIDGFSSQGRDLLFLEEHVEYTLLSETLGVSDIEVNSETLNCESNQVTDGLSHVPTDLVVG